MRLEEERYEAQGAQEDQVKQTTLISSFPSRKLKSRFRTLPEEVAKRIAA